MCLHYACSPADMMPDTQLGKHTFAGRQGPYGGYALYVYVHLHRSVKLTVNHITYIVVSTQNVYHNMLQLLQ